MKNVICFVLTGGVFMLGLASAQAQSVVTVHNLSSAAALAVASAAYDSCQKTGHKVSVHVVGREGEVLVALRGDGSAVHTFENSFRKAYSALTFGVPSGDLVQRLKDNPAFSVVHLKNIIVSQGGLPIKVDNELVGAIGVSGDSTGADDENCASAGVHALQSYKG